MFQDDSTESFEDLEKRLKTPAKLKSSRIAKTKTPIRKKLVVADTNEEIPQKPEFTENFADQDIPKLPNGIPAEVDKNVIFETVIEESELPKTPTFTKPE